MTTMMISITMTTNRNTRIIIYGKASFNINTSNSALAEGSVDGSADGSVFPPIK